MARTQGFVEITQENQVWLRDKGPREAMKILKIPTLKAPFVVRKLRSGIHKVMPTLRVMRGMAFALTELKRQGYFLGIITSNSKANVNQFLYYNQIDFFDYIRAGSGVFRKTYAIRIALLRNGFKKSEVMFVGDEIRDIEAAQKVGMAVTAVTWGINSRQGLQGVNPDFIVDTSEELIDVLSR